MLSRTLAEKRNGSWEMTPTSRRSDRRVTSRTSTPSMSTRPSTRVVEARHERGERRLARPRGADQRDRACRPRSRGRCPRARAARGRSRSRRPSKTTRPGPAGSSPASGSVGDLLGLVDHLEEPLARGGRTLGLADPHAEHPQRHHEHHQQQVEGEEAADRELALDDVVPAASSTPAWASIGRKVSSGT